MNRKERLTKESHFTTGATVISAIFLVGIAALLVTAEPLHLSVAAMPAAQHATERADRDIGASGMSRSIQASDAAASMATQDRAPAQTF